MSISASRGVCSRILSPVPMVDRNSQPVAVIQNAAHWPVNFSIDVLISKCFIEPALSFQAFEKHPSCIQNGAIGCREVGGDLGRIMYKT